MLNLLRGRFARLAITLIAAAALLSPSPAGAQPYSWQHGYSVALKGPDYWYANSATARIEVWYEYFDTTTYAKAAAFSWSNQPHVGPDHIAVQYRLVDNYGSQWYTSWHYNLDDYVGWTSYNHNSTPWYACAIFYRSDGTFSPWYC